MNQSAPQYQESFERWKALIEEGNQAYTERRYAAAEVAFGAALKEAESWPSQGAGAMQEQLDSRLTKSLNNLAALCHSQGKYRMAEDLYVKALEIKRRIYREEHDEIALALQNLAILYSAKKDFNQAEAFFMQALRIREKVLPPNHADLARTLQNYALMLDKVGRKEEAQVLELRATKILSSEPA
jgi:tetratricopeptide (TPR) repeat protein